MEKDWRTRCYAASILSVIKWLGYKNKFTTMYPVGIILSEITVCKSIHFFQVQTFSQV
uniref:Uncharacterized protein n=1 Tax=Triticum urartu TaxID=4572 RepID=A0A8R7TFW0_TRIUA